MKSLRRSWEWFRALPSWIVLAVAAAAYMTFLLDWMPRFLRWPARFVMPVLGIYGYVGLFFDLKGRSFRQGLAVVLKHPFTFVIALTVACLTIEEQFPFSHFPMYSAPAPEGDYYYLAKAGVGGETEPLPVSELAGISAAKLGKIYRDRRDAYCKAKDRHSEGLRPKDTQIIGAEVLDYVHEIAVKRQGESGVEPAEWRLMHVEIAIRGGDEPGFDETPTILAKRNFNP